MNIKNYCQICSKFTSLYYYSQTNIRLAYKRIPTIPTCIVTILKMIKATNAQLYNTCNYFTSLSTIFECLCWTLPHDLHLHIHIAYTAYLLQKVQVENMHIALCTMEAFMRTRLAQLDSEHLPLNL